MNFLHSCIGAVRSLVNSVFFRALVIGLLVFTFYNPTVYCFWTIVINSIRGTPDVVTWPLPFVAVVFMFYFAFAAWMARLTHNALGHWGIAVVVLIFAALVWAGDWLAYRYLSATWSIQAAVWVGEGLVGTILFVGLMYPRVTRWFGQQVTVAQQTDPSFNPPHHS